MSAAALLVVPPLDTKNGIEDFVENFCDWNKFEFTSSKTQDIEKLLLPKVGQGEYRRLILRVPGFGKSSKQVNSAFIIVLLEDWKKRDRKGNRIMMESFREISKVPGVLSFPVMPQGIRTGGVEKPVQFVILGNTYDELIEWKEIIKKRPEKIII